MKGIISKIARKIRKAVYQSAVLELAVCDLRYPVEEVNKRRRPDQFLPITPEDLPSIQADFGKNVAAKFEKRLDHARGWLIRFRDRNIGYCWGSDGLVEKEGLDPFYLDLKPKKGAIYMRTAASWAGCTQFSPSRSINTET